MYQVNYTAQKSWKPLDFVMRVLKRNRNTISLAYASLVSPFLEYGAACWDPCRGQTNELDRVQTKASQFTNSWKYCDWANLAHSWTIARLCTLFKACPGERTWKAKRDR